MKKRTKEILSGVLVFSIALSTPAGMAVAESMGQQQETVQAGGKDTAECSSETIAEVRPESIAEDTSVNLSEECNEYIAETLMEEDSEGRSELYTESASDDWPDEMPGNTLKHCTESISETSSDVSDSKSDIESEIQSEILSEESSEESSESSSEPEQFPENEPERSLEIETEQSTENEPESGQSTESKTESEQSSKIEKETESEQLPESEPEVEQSTEVETESEQLPEDASEIELEDSCETESETLPEENTKTESSETESSMKEDCTGNLNETIYIKEVNNSIATDTGEHDKNVPALKEVWVESEFHEAENTDSEQFLVKDFVLKGTFCGKASAVNKIEYTTDLQMNDSSVWLEAKNTQNAEPETSVVGFHIALPDGIYPSIAIRACDENGNVSAVGQLVNNSGESIKVVVDSTSDTAGPAAQNPSAVTPAVKKTVKLKTTLPEVSQSKATTPEISNPGMSNPEILDSGVSNPEILDSEVFNSEILDSGVSNPEISNPEISNPGMSNLEISNPGIQNQKVIGSEVSESGITKSENAATQVLESELVKDTEASKPEIAKTEVLNPEISKSEIPEPKSELKSDSSKSEAAKSDSVKVSLLPPEHLKPNQSKLQLSEPQSTENIAREQVNETALYSVITDENADNSKSLRAGTLLELSEDGVYSIAANGAGPENQPETFIIDRIVPKMTVELVPAQTIQTATNHAVQNDSFNTGVTAVIRVTEHNFREEDFTINMTSAAEKGTWSHDGDVHTLRIPFDRDDTYHIECTYADMYGNSVKAVKKEFLIDTAAPAITIEGVRDNSANNSAIRPVISVADSNMELSDITVSVMTGTGDLVQSAIDTELVSSENGTGYRLTLTDIAEQPDNVYHLFVSACDKAGNVAERTYRFSLNRNGSVYDLTSLKQLVDQKYSTYSALNDIQIVEMNMDIVEEFDLYISRNGALGYKAEYTKEISGSEDTGYTYLYRIKKENFAEEGTYRLTMYSRDRAGNEVNNAADINGDAITFVVDNTAPKVIIDGVESGNVYEVEAQKVHVAVMDNFMLDEAELLLVNEANEVLERWDYIALAGEDGALDITIPQYDGKLSLLYRVKDATGNEIQTFPGDTAAPVGFVVDASESARVPQGILPGFMTGGSLLTAILLSIKRICRKK